MIKVTAVTTMSKNYYDISGQWAVKTFQKYWHDIKLHIYSEDKLLISDKNKIIMHDMNELDNGYFEFLSRQHRPRIQVFSIKAFVLLKAIESFDSDYLVWHDGDLITKREVTPDYFADLCGDNLIVYNGIDYLWDKKDGLGERIFHSCDSGFFILNLKHPEIKKFHNRYKEYYMNEITANLKRFYDNDVLGNVIVELEKNGCNTRDLNKFSRDRFSPMNMKGNILKPYFTHFKGGKKEFKPIEELVKPYL